MNIISHRGYWLTPAEKNTLSAFERSFAAGFGTETDFRDAGGKLVISHDPATTGALPAEAVLALLAQANPALPLAMNIKADGLQHLVRAALDAAGIANYFLFDMSVPDAVQSLKAGLRIYTRQSDVEPAPVLYAEAAGVWMDALRDDTWLTAERILTQVERGKEVCLVSPELHRRPHEGFWRLLANTGVARDTRVTLCTDLPVDARAFFRP
ncbi:MAG: phosphodiesterase [Verrucomicrobia bacterium]|nr:phosphodiesterase [Verrucomicrobiota bacterium]